MGTLGGERVVDGWSGVGFGMVGGLSSVERGASTGFDGGVDGCVGWVLDMGYCCGSRVGLVGSCGVGGVTAVYFTFFRQLKRWAGGILEIWRVECEVLTWHG